MTVRVVPLDLDSEVFGLSCGRLVFGESPPSCEALHAAIAHASEQNIRHLVARVPSEWGDVCRELESRGFRFAACSLSLEKRIPNRAFPPAPTLGESGAPGDASRRRAAGFSPRGASKRDNATPRRTPTRAEARSSSLDDDTALSGYQGEDDARLLAITDEAFNAGTRFHVESAFRPAGVVALHRRWITNLIADDAVSIWVHRIGGTITGYITLARGDDPNAGHIGLIGVDPAFRQRGIGRALLHTIEEAAHPALGKITVVTESTNIAALRLYTQAGFTIEQSWTVFHAMIPASREVTHAGTECRTADPRT